MSRSFHHSAWLRQLAYWGVKLGPRWWVRYSPPVFGLMMCLGLPRERTMVRKNLRRLFGARPKWRELLDVGATFAGFSHALTEQLGLERPEALKASCTVENQQELSALLESTDGLVVVTAHTAAWELAARRLMADTRRRVVLVMEAEPDPLARRVHERLREKGDVRVLYVGQDPLSVMSLLGHLRSGGIVAMQIDRAASGGKVVEIPFGQGTLPIPLGPFILSAAAGVPLLPLYVSRRDHFDYRVTLGPTERLPRHPSSEELRESATRVGRSLLAHLLKHPTEWFHFVDR